MPSPRPDVLALLRACKELPDEDVHRLVLADWLEENADDPDEVALRDLIRLQVECDSLPAGDERRKPLATGAARLLDRHGKSWLGTLDTDRVNWGLQHGLFVMTAHEEDLSAGRLGTPGFPEGWAWVERLTVLCTLGCDFTKLAKAAPLGHVGTLDLRRNTLRDSGAKALAESPLLENLCGLVLSYTSLGRRGLQAILKSPHLRGLNRLELDYNALNSSEMKSLAAWPGLSRLTRLSLSLNPISDEGVEVLVERGKLRQVRELHLRGCGLQTPAMKHLAAADLPNLRELDLSENQLLDSDALQALLPAKWIGGVERLGLGHTAIGGQGVAMLADCPDLTALTHLDLRGIEVDRHVLGSLVRSRHRGGLRVLDLRPSSVPTWTPRPRQKDSSLERPGLRILY